MLATLQLRTKHLAPARLNRYLYEAKAGVLCNLRLTGRTRRQGEHAC
jgi:hypothetical protein